MIQAVLDVELCGRLITLLRFALGAN
jgi:hypothetical protein